MTTENLPPSGDAPKKKKRGRPRKNPENTTPAKKKKRGRPKKVKVTDEVPEIVIDPNSLPDTQTDVTVRAYEGNQEETAGIINNFDDLATTNKVVPPTDLENSPFITENPLLADIEAEVDHAAVAEEERIRAEVEGLIEEDQELTGADTEIEEKFAPFDPLDEVASSDEVASLDEVTPSDEVASSDEKADDFEDRVEEEVKRRMEARINQKLSNRDLEGPKLSVHERLLEAGKTPISSIKLTYRLNKPRPVYKLTKGQVLNMPFLMAEDDVEDVMIACEDSLNVYLYRMKDITCLM